MNIYDPFQGVRRMRTPHPQLWFDKFMEILK